MATGDSHDRSRILRRLGSVLVALAGVVLALVFVRLALDWSDSRPYEGDVTEARYLLFMVVAAVLVLAGLVAAVVLWRRGGRP